MTLSYEQWLMRVYHLQLNSPWAKKNRDILRGEYDRFMRKYENSKYPHKRFAMVGRNFGDDRSR